MEFGELEPALQSFVLLHPEYSVPDGADGMCFFASVEFQEVLDELGLLSEGLRETSDGWDVIKVRQIGSPPIEVPRYTIHWAFRWKSLAIDWTARQFWEEARWPEIWKLGS